MMHRARLLSLLALAGGLVVGATPASVWGQDADLRSEDRGWVGISYEVQGLTGGRVWVVVTEVSEGSPASRAGILVGDTLITINGHRAHTNFDNVPMRIRPGQPVEVVVTRQGRPQAIRIVAGERPAGVNFQSSYTFTVTADSMAESMFRAMDSLRLTLITTGADSAWVVGGTRGRTAQFQLQADSAGNRVVVDARSNRMREVGASQLAPVQDVTLQEVRAPFGFWVFRTEAHDSLRRAMEEFNHELRALRVREAARLQPYTDAAGRVNLAAAEAELGDLTSVLKAYAERSSALRQAIDRAALEATRPRSGYVTTWARPDEPVDAAPEPRNEFFGPLTPYALGQNRVAGAEIADLPPGLAAYFEVDGGVLVVDVLPGTPMAAGGVLAGDVITHLDRVTIRSVQDLRLAWSRAGDSLPFTVVRKGERVQLLLHR